MKVALQLKHYFNNVFSILCFSELRRYCTKQIYPYEFGIMYLCVNFLIVKYCVINEQEYFIRYKDTRR